MFIMQGGCSQVMWGLGRQGSMCVAHSSANTLRQRRRLPAAAAASLPQAVQPHMGKCFDGIRRLDFGDDPKSIDIFAMISGEGERVNLGKNLKARGNVEKWLCDVEAAMIASLKRLSRQGYQSYAEEPREEWVLKQPAQLVIAVSQIYWCAAVDEQLRGTTPTEGLQRFLQVRGGMEGWEEGVQGS